MTSEYIISAHIPNNATPVYWGGNNLRWTGMFSNAKRYLNERDAKAVRTRLEGDLLSQFIECEIEEIETFQYEEKTRLTYWIPKLQFELKDFLLGKSQQLKQSLTHFYPDAKFLNKRAHTTLTLNLLTRLSWDWKRNGYPDKNEDLSVLENIVTSVAITPAYLTTQFPTATFFVDLDKTVRNGIVPKGNYCLNLSLKKELFQSRKGLSHSIIVPLIFIESEHYPIWHMGLFDQNLTGGNISNIKNLVSVVDKGDKKTQLDIINKILRPQPIGWSHSQINQDKYFADNADLRYSVPGVLLVHKLRRIKTVHGDFPLIEIKGRAINWVNLFEYLGWE